MTMQRQQHSVEFKAKVTLEAIRGERIINELAAEYGGYPVKMTQWKKVVLEEVPKLFASRRRARPGGDQPMATTTAGPAATRVRVGRTGLQAVNVRSDRYTSIKPASV